ncbi:MAG: hypothetical protein EBZ77_10775 [Chitinophagia bacterium]|nr:hypothetical protein [Chitinophagia bacterium]
MVRLLHFHKKEYETPGYGVKVSRYILVIVLVTALPSIYLALKIVEKSIFEANARLFVREEFRFADTYVINKTYRYNNGVKEIDLLLLGADLPATTIDTLRNRLKKYHLGKTNLIIHQGMNARQQLDLAEIKASILQNLPDLANGSSADSLKYPADKKDTLPDIGPELKVLYPQITAYSASNVALRRVDTAVTDSVLLFYYTSVNKLKGSEELRLKNWLQSRMPEQKVVIASGSQ